VLSSNPEHQDRRSRPAEVVRADRSTTVARTGAAGSGTPTSRLWPEMWRLPWSMRLVPQHILPLNFSERLPS